MRTIRNYKGFTLIEMMITVAVIAILAAIAYPSYVDYLRRGAIPEGLAALSDGKVKMEQFFMDRRTYAGGCARHFPAGMTVGRFGITCASVAANLGATPPIPESYTLTATGTGIVANFVYTLDNTNTRTSTLTGAWTGTSGDCWILKKDGSC